MNKLTSITLTALALAPLAIALALSAGNATAAEPKSPTATPCLDVLARCFKNIKTPTTSPVQRAPSVSDEQLPGNGLAQHAMLYVGEGLNAIFLVNEGQVQCGPTTPARAANWTMCG